MEREYQYERGEERGEERGVGGVKLKIPTFLWEIQSEEYLQYESRIEHVFDCNK